MGRASRLRMPLAAAVALRGIATAAAEVASRPLHMVFGAANIPHPEKAAKGGEDAFFANDERGTFGVADGVGGSASAKVDPGMFSREILRRCHESMQPGHAVADALRMASAERLELGGSSTMLLGQLEPETHKLTMLNLGDSGAMLLRPSFRRFSRMGNVIWPRLVLRSMDQTHGFNTPYQTDASDFAGCIARCDEVSTIAREGDVLIAATDGVLDNLHDAQIQTAVAKCMGELRAAEPDAAQKAVDALADTLANEAHAVGLKQDEPGVHTPFELAAAQEGYRFLGGKLDDIAVVVGLVRVGAPPAPRVLCNFE